MSQTLIAGFLALLLIFASWTAARKPLPVEPLLPVIPKTAEYCEPPRVDVNGSCVLPEGGAGS